MSGLARGMYLLRCIIITRTSFCSGCTNYSNLSGHSIGTDKFVALDAISALEQFVNEMKHNQHCHCEQSEAIQSHKLRLYYSTLDRRAASRLIGTCIFRRDDETGTASV